MTRRRHSLAAGRFDVAGAVDDVNRLAMRADALACATERQLEQGDCGDRRLWLEHHAHLLGATRESVQAVAYACALLAAELAKREVT
jgi:hypothetical protein